MNDSIISHIPLFAGLPPSEIRLLAETLQLREIPAGTVFIHEGGQDDRFYILLDGQVEVFKAMVGQVSSDEEVTEEEVSQINGEERSLAKLDQGAMIGEMSLFSRDGRHTASVRSLTPLRLLEMTRGDFDSLLHRQPGVTYDLVRLLSRRLERSENITILDLQEKNLQLTVAYRELEAAQAQIVEKEKMDHELQLAREIQLTILPEEIPALEGFEFGAMIVPARAVGGDFYDFIPLDDNQMGIVVGDVSDKSIPAAMYMSLSYGLIRAEARRLLSPAETLINVNRHLIEVSTSGMFVTVLYGILNRVTREFRFARAGHEYPIILESSGQALKMKRTSGLLMGLFDDLNLEEESITFPPGGTALIYSDGVTEAMNRQGEQFGAARAQDFLCRYASSFSPGSEPCTICEKLLRELQTFVGGELQHDDITIVAFRG